MADCDTTRLAGSAAFPETMEPAMTPIDAAEAPPRVALNALRAPRAPLEQSVMERLLTTAWAMVTHSRQLSVLTVQMCIAFIRLFSTQFMPMYRVHDSNHPYDGVECKLWTACPEISGPNATSPTNPSAGTGVPSGVLAGPVTCPDLIGYFSWMRLVFIIAAGCFIAAAVMAGQFVRDGRSDIVAKMYVLMVAMTAGAGMVLLDSIEEATRHDRVCSHTTLAEAGYDVAAAEGIDVVLAPTTYIVVLIHMVIAVHVHRKGEEAGRKAALEAEGIPPLEMADVTAQAA